MEIWLGWSWIPSSRNDNYRSSIQCDQCGFFEKVSVAEVVRRLMSRNVSISSDKINISHYNYRDHRRIMMNANCWLVFMLK